MLIPLQPVAANGFEMTTTRSLQVRCSRSDLGLTKALQRTAQKARRR